MKTDLTKEVAISFGIYVVRCCQIYMEGNKQVWAGNFFLEDRWKEYITLPEYKRLTKKR